MIDTIQIPGKHFGKSIHDLSLSSLKYIKRTTFDEVLCDSINEEIETRLYFKKNKSY